MSNTLTLSKKQKKKLKEYLEAASATGISSTSWGPKWTNCHGERRSSSSITFHIMIIKTTGKKPMYKTVIAAGRQNAHITETLLEFDTKPSLRHVLNKYKREYGVEVTTPTDSDAAEASDGGGENESAIAESVGRKARVTYGLGGVSSGRLASQAKPERHTVTSTLPSHQIREGKRNLYEGQGGEQGTSPLQPLTLQTQDSTPCERTHVRTPSPRLQTPDPRPQASDLRPQIPDLRHIKNVTGKHDAGSSGCAYPLSY